MSTPFVLGLEAASATLAQVGGKGASLVRLVAADLRVPPGFAVTTEAYRRFVSENGLQEKLLAAVSTGTVADASGQIGGLFATGEVPEDIARAVSTAYAALGGDGHAVAVRSSATAEDLPDLSFAGQQETYLNVRGEAAILDAVKRCWASLWSARAMAYRARHGIPSEDVSMAVVVQVMVPADAAGILFTANPVTGARDQVVINAAWGLGEAVVGGQVTPDTFVVDKRTGSVVHQQVSEKTVMTVAAVAGTHEALVPTEMRSRAALGMAQVADLASIGVQIEALYGQPMDVEWALHDGKVYILQARPITALREQQPALEEWNDSLKGDFLWTNSNLGEAVPDVMTPCTWSLMQMFIGEVMPQFNILGYQAAGNIGGRLYLNLSIPASAGAALGASRQRMAEASEEVYGRIPDDLEIPVLPASRWQVLGELLPSAIRVRLRVRANGKRLPAFLAAAAERSDTLRARAGSAASTAELAALWRSDVGPFFRECSNMLEAGARGGGNILIMGFRRSLCKLAGEADANALLSGTGGGSGQLASLGPLMGLTQLAQGEIDRATFARQYGHRGPHEFEVSMARPAEDPDWIERHITGLSEAPMDVPALLSRQQEAHAAAWERLCRRHPHKAPAIRRKLDQAAASVRQREAARSEVIRCFWTLRAFVLRAGELTGHGDDLFFLSIHEILAVLAGDHAAVERVSSRRATYERYRRLPAYPSWIRGPFDPFTWAADPNRSSHLYDATRATLPARDAVTGFPGAEGVVEGTVRVVHAVEDGDQLKVGEVLVTTVTNIGWTPLFPRARAVVTDVGAPLSHAAIVARELGIPAVVGCGNATMRLRTGDRVRVDGGKGTVEVLP